MDIDDSIQGDESVVASSATATSDTAAAEPPPNPQQEDFNPEYETEVDDKRQGEGGDAVTADTTAER